MNTSHLKKSGALLGALVADSAALGLHWLYDQEQIARVESTGDILFRQPDSNSYENCKGYFAQGGRHAGQLSHYGESARLVAQVCADGRYDTESHRGAFYAAFGPCGSFSGYADRPTKALIAAMITDADHVNDPSGVDDDQLPGLCPVPAVFANELPRDTALGAVQVISTNEQVWVSAEILYTCLELLAKGATLKKALEASAITYSGLIPDLLSEAMALDSYQPLEAAVHFGLACHVSQGMPLAWHLLYHADSFEMAVRDNIRCGGDSCGRAMVLGAIAGMAFDIPEKMLQRFENTHQARALGKV